MNGSRMDRYEKNSLENMSRTERNKQIYNSTDFTNLSRIRTNTNVSILSDGQKDISIDKIRKYLLSQKNREGSKRVSIELPKESEPVVKKEEPKEYDINAVLERAREKREINYEDEKYRKIETSQIQIELLNNIKNKEEQTEKESEFLTCPIEMLNTEEKTIVELIQTIQMDQIGDKKDLFDDLLGDDSETKVIGMSQDENQDIDELKEELKNMTQELEQIKVDETEFTKEINKTKELMDLEDKDSEEEKEEDTELVEIDDSNEYEEECDLPDEEKEEEKNKEQKNKIDSVDKSFYTNTMQFSKTDFEGFEEIEKNAKTSSVFAKISIVLIIIMLIITTYIILKYVVK